MSFLVTQLIGFGAGGAALSGNSISSSVGTLPTTIGGNLTVRLVYAAALFSVSSSAVRFTFQAPTGGGTLSKFYIGPYAGSGDAYDASALTQVTFDGGNASTGAVGSGATKVSDIIPYNLDKSVAQILSFYNSAGDMGYRTGAQANISTYYKTGDEAATANVTGYSQDAANTPWAVSLFEY